MNVFRLFQTTLGLSLVLTFGVAHAEPKRVIESARVRLGDVAQTKDPELSAIDLGPAPPPGNSRLFAKRDVLRVLAAFGAETRNVSMPSSVRIVSAGRRFTPKELEQLVDTQVRDSLPAGVSLKTLRVSRPLLASPQIEVGDVRVPRLVRRAGESTVTASVDLLHEGEVALRLPVTLIVELSEQAAAPLVRKGARVDLVIARGPARISATAVALEDADAGDVRSFRVSSTSKVLRARVESATLATVVTP